MCSIIALPAAILVEMLYPASDFVDNLHGLWYYPMR